jgi:polyphosphate kinase
LRDPALRQRVIDEGLDVYLDDNCDAWELQASGEWIKLAPVPGQPRRSAQNELLQWLQAPVGSATKDY